MKYLTLLLILSPFLSLSQNVGIGTTSPDTSALLEIQSTTGGILIPRLTTSERNAIPIPAEGLLIFNSENTRFEFYNGTSWNPIAAASNAGSEISDADSDTKIITEQSFDEDTIRMQVAGHSIAKLDDKTFHLEAQSHGTFLGLNAGKSVPNTDSWNTFIGHRSGENTSTGISNTFTGAYSGNEGNKGNANSFYGVLSGGENTGSNNTFYGIQSGQISSNSSENTYLGAVAGGQNTGSQNIGIGFFSMYTGSGNNNIGIGNHSLFSVGNGTSNLVAIGDSTLHVSGQNVSFPFQGINNTAVGSKALKKNQTGTGNTALGYHSLENNYSGINNTGVGSSSLTRNTSGIYNTAVGAVSLFNNDTGSNNTSIGYSAGRSNQMGSNNTFVGSQSGDNNNGSANTFIGTDAGLSTAAGSSNTFIGHNSGRINIAGERNIAVGTISGGLGNSNTHIGFASGKASNSSHSVAIGDSTLIQDTGYGSVAIGSKAGLSNLNGDRNIYIGDSSGFQQANGDENIFIGYKSGGFSSGAVGAIAIGTRSGLVSGSESISIGYEANIWGAARNISIGKLAGSQGTGQESIYLGNYMGFTNSENHRLFIGNLAFGPLIYGEMENRTVEVKNNFITGTARLRAPTNDARLFMKTKSGTEGRVIVKQDSTENIFIGDIDNEGNDVIFRTSAVDRMFLSASGNLGLGQNATQDRFTLDAEDDQVPLNIKYRGITKMKVHTNGGVSLGGDALPPMDGLLVQDLANSGDHPLRVNDAGIIYKDELSKYKSYSPPSFVDNPLSGIVSNNSPSFRLIPANTFIWADWGLPDNSQAKTFKIYFEAETTESIKVEIFKKPIASPGNPIALKSFLLFGNGSSTLATGSTVLNETIDNQNNSYYFRIWNENNSGGVWILGVTQSYQE